MSRRHKFFKDVTFDHKYHCPIVLKFINYLTLDGKKSVAELIVYESIKNLSIHLNMKPLNAFHLVLDILRPLTEVTSRRVGGSTYQIPIDINNSRGISLALKWIISSSRSKKTSNKMSERLFLEFIDTLDKKSSSYKKRDNLHKVAESNKAFSHYKY